MKNICQRCKIKLTLKRESGELHTRGVGTLQSSSEKIEFKLQEELVPGKIVRSEVKCIKLTLISKLTHGLPCNFLSKAVWFRRIELDSHSEGVRRSNWKYKIFK